MYFIVPTRQPWSLLTTSFMTVFWVDFRSPPRASSECCIGDQKFYDRFSGLFQRFPYVVAEGQLVPCTLFE